MSHKKFWPDRFSRFDVYWIQTNRQTIKQTDRQAKFIYRFVMLTTKLISKLLYCHTKSYIYLEMFETPPKIQKNVIWLNTRYKANFNCSHYLFTN